ncbi:MAG: glycine--tRNA ligase, partial [Thermoplasmata archaeon]|nr:glycine--tRNA ligase [Thermoplasmata archaeon]
GIIANEPLAYFMHLTQHILISAGLDSEKLRFRQHLKTEMAHYAEDCWDCEAMTGYGWLELVGVADRGCYDLESHIKESGAELTAFIRFPEPVEKEMTLVVPNLSKLGPLFKGKAGKVAEKMGEISGEGLDASQPIVIEIDGEEFIVPTDCFEVKTEKQKITGERIVPHVIEPSYGLDRIFYTIMDHNYQHNEEEDYVTLKLPVAVSPIKFGVFPLMTKDGLEELAQGIDRRLRIAGILTYFDGSGTVGRRYARMDEAGTPFCITIDYESKDDDCVTIRHRDTKEQKRVKMNDIEQVARGLIDGSLNFDSIG